MSNKRKTFTLIIGANGSGKTTLVRSILGDGFVVRRGVDARHCHTESADGRIAACGKYDITCGGGDSLGCTKDMFDMAKGLLRSGAFDSVILESMMFSTIVNKPLRNMLEYRDWGVDVELLFLMCGSRECVRRVMQRSGRMPDAEKIREKIRGMNRIYALHRRIALFNVMAFDVSAMSPEEVFDEFRRRSYIYAGK